MEYLPGQDLEKRIERQGPLSEAEALLYIRQMGAALEVVHGKGLLHRDIKPANILTSPDHSRAVLIDFGIARHFFDQIRTYSVALSPHYAPLEQFNPKTKLNVTTDIYALSATLYYLITGQTPTPAPNRMAGVALEAPHQLAPQITPQTQAAILQGMAIKPEDRPQTLQTWLDLLADTAPAPPQSHPSLPHEHPRISNPSELPPSIPNREPLPSSELTGASRLAQTSDHPIHTQPPHESAATVGADQLSGRSTQPLTPNRSQAAPTRKLTQIYTPTQVLQSSPGAQGGSAQARQGRQGRHRWPLGLVGAVSGVTLFMIVIGVLSSSSRSAAPSRSSSPLPPVTETPATEITMPPSVRPDPSPTLMAVFDQIQVLRDQGNYEACLQDVASFVNPSSLEISNKLSDLLGECQWQRSQQLAAAGQLRDAIVLADQVDPDHPQFELATAAILEWSETILDLATEHYQKGDLEQALQLAEAIPEVSILYPNARDQAEAWIQEWQTNQQLAERARMALDQGNWQGAIAIARTLTVSSSHWQQEHDQIISKALELSPPRPLDRPPHPLPHPPRPGSAPPPHLHLPARPELDP